MNDFSMPDIELRKTDRKRPGDSIPGGMKKPA